LVIERGGQPIAALVPLSDLADLDPDRRRRERLRAIEEIRRAAQRSRAPTHMDATEAIRQERRLRDGQIMRAVRRPTPEE